MDNPSLNFLECVNSKLVQLGSEFVYIGGTVIPFHVPRLTQSHDYRETLDIDVIVQALKDYWDIPDFEEKLKGIGIHNSFDHSDPKCRYILHDEILGDIKIDFLATTPEVLGFPCKWFPEAANNTQTFNLPSGAKIRVPKLRYIMGLKLEAFFDRGADEIYESKDLQDIILLLTDPDNRDLLRQRVSEGEITDYLWTSFHKLAEIKDLVDFIGHDFRADEKDVGDDILKYLNSPAPF